MFEIVIVCFITVLKYITRCTYVNLRLSCYGHVIKIKLFTVCNGVSNICFIYGLTFFFLFLPKC